MSKQRNIPTPKIVQLKKGKNADQKWCMMITNELGKKTFKFYPATPEFGKLATLRDSTTVMLRDVLDYKVEIMERGMLIVASRFDPVLQKDVAVHKIIIMREEDYLKLLKAQDNLKVIAIAEAKKKLQEDALKEAQEKALLND